MLIIKNGKVIDPVADRVYPADLYIENDTMVKIVDHDKERAEQDGKNPAVEPESGLAGMDNIKNLAALHRDLRIRMCISGIRALRIKRIFCRERRLRRRADTHRLY